MRANAMFRGIVLDEVFDTVFVRNDFGDPDIGRQVGEFAEVLLAGAGCHGGDLLEKKVVDICVTIRCRKCVKDTISTALWKIEQAAWMFDGVATKTWLSILFRCKKSQPLENTGFEGNFDVNGVETNKEVLET